MLKRFALLVAATAALTLALVACTPHGDRTGTAYKPPTAAPVVTTEYVPLSDEERLADILDDYNFKYSTPGAAVGMAIEICQYRERHSTYETVNWLLDLERNSEDPGYYTPEDIGHLVQASFIVYCPQFSAS